MKQKRSFLYTCVWAVFSVLIFSSSGVLWLQDLLWVEISSYEFAFGYGVSWWSSNFPGFENDPEPAYADVPLPPFLLDAWPGWTPLIIQDPYVCGSNIHGQVLYFEQLEQQDIWLTLYQDGVIRYNFEVSLDSEWKYQLPINYHDPLDPNFIQSGKYRVVYAVLENDGLTQHAGSYRATITDVCDDLAFVLPPMLLNTWPQSSS